jgi:hypothetical protein
VKHCRVCNLKILEKLDKHGIAVTSEVLIPSAFSLTVLYAHNAYQQWVRLFMSALPGAYTYELLCARGITERRNIRVVITR